MISSKEIKEIKHKPNTRIKAKVSSTHLFNYVIPFYMDMGIAQRYIIKGSRLKVIKTTFNLNSWIKKFEKSKKNLSKLHYAILISTFYLVNLWLSIISHELYIFFLTLTLNHVKIMTNPIVAQNWVLDFLTNHDASNVT